MNVAKVALRFTAATDVGADGLPVYTPGVESVTTFHVMRDASDPPLSPASAEDIANAVYDWWLSPLDDYFAALEAFSVTTVLMDVTVTRIQPTTDDPVVVVRPYLNLSGRNESSAPPQLAPGVTLHTTVESRNGRGRMYLPAPAGSIYGSQGESDATWRDALGNVAQHLAASIRSVGASGPDPGPWVLAVYSRTLGAVHPVVRFSVAETVLTQRRRRVWPRVYHEYDLVAP